MLLKDNGGGDFEQPEPGNYAAVCYRIVDIGTQTEEYQGKTMSRRKVMITFELDELMSDGRPFSQSKWYTASLGEKANLRKDLESWRGKAFTAEELQGFAPDVLLGAPCMLNLIKTDKGKIRISSIGRLPKGMVKPIQKNESLMFSLDNFDQAVFDKLSDGIKKLIMASPEFHDLKKQPNDSMADLREDIPF